MFDDDFDDNFVRNAFEQRDRESMTVDSSSEPARRQREFMNVEVVSADSAAPPTSQSEPPADSAALPTSQSEPPADSAVLPTSQSEPPADSAAPPTSQSEPPADSAAPPTSQSEPPADSAAPPTSQSEPPRVDDAASILFHMSRDRLTPSFSIPTTVNTESDEINEFSDNDSNDSNQFSDNDQLDDLDHVLPTVPSAECQRFQPSTGILLNNKIEIKWTCPTSKESTYYRGTVTDVDLELNQYFVEYEDGDKK
jgi:hypothetical protein